VLCRPLMQQSLTWLAATCIDVKIVVPMTAILDQVREAPWPCSVGRLTQRPVVGWFTGTVYVNLRTLRPSIPPLRWRLLKYTTITLAFAQAVPHHVFDTYARDFDAGWNGHVA
jgi:hypothetical protein